MKKFMIRCDMEGVSGIVSYEQAEPGRSEYAIGQKWFMSDLNAAIRGLKDGGADEIHIYDEHCAGRNILLDELPDCGGVYIYAGKPAYTAHSPGGLDESFDGLILLGFHSKRGSENCLLQHSYEPDIRDIRVNGISVGEIGMESLIAADFGVPLVMITADSEGIKEAEAFGCSDCRYVCVKRSLSEFGAVCYPTSAVFEKIYREAYSVAKNTCGAVRKEIKRETVKIEIDFFDTAFAGMYVKMYGKPVFENVSVSEGWAMYQERKLGVSAIISKEKAL